MELAHRMTALTVDGSDGWDVFYKARALKKQGHPIIELTIGEHDIRTHMDILAAMGRSARGGAHRLCCCAGHRGSARGRGPPH